MKTRFDISPNQAYWVVVCLLLSATVVFTYSVQSRRRAWKPKASDLKITSGDTAKVTNVVDADELTVKDKNGVTFVVRLLGVKGFDPTENEPQVSAFGQSAVAAMKRMALDRDVVIEFQNFKQDRVGRVLAYLSFKDKDLGLELVREGLVVVYTRYPFARQDKYEAVEAEARSRRAGLWANDKATERVNGWKASWKALLENQGGGG